MSVVENPEHQSYVKYQLADILDNFLAVHHKSSSIKASMLSALPDSNLLLDL